MNHQALKAAIDAEGTLSGADDAAVLAWVNTAITQPDDRRITITTLMAELSLTESATVIATIRAEAEAGNATSVLVDEALRQLRGGGLDLSHGNSQSMIDSLFAGNATLAAKVKALGQQSIERWRDLGFPVMGDESKLYHIGIARGL